MPAAGKLKEENSPRDPLTALVGAESHLRVQPWQRGKGPHEQITAALLGAAAVLLMQTRGKLYREAKDHLKPTICLIRSFAAIPLQDAAEKLRATIQASLMEQVASSKTQDPENLCKSMQASLDQQVGELTQRVNGVLMARSQASYEKIKEWLEIEWSRSGKESIAWIKELTEPLTQPLPNGSAAFLHDAITQLRTRFDQFFIERQVNFHEHMGEFLTAAQISLAVEIKQMSASAEGSSPQVPENVFGILPVPHQTKVGGRIGAPSFFWLFRDFWGDLSGFFTVPADLRSGFSV